MACGVRVLVLVRVFRGNARRRVADVTPLADSGSQ
jgi:hypothetical protein